MKSRMTLENDVCLTRDEIRSRVWVREQSEGRRGWFRMILIRRSWLRRVSLLGAEGCRDEKADKKRQFAERDRKNHFVGRNQFSCFECLGCELVVFLCWMSFWSRQGCLLTRG